jgi:BMFP domain-containing protein YqiC
MASDQASGGDAETVITSLMERLREQIEMLLPEDSVNSVLQQAGSTLRQGFAEFELVPRRELDGHLAALKQLTDTIKDLEQRIAELESAR